jgi:hypothetical protein
LRGEDKAEPGSDHHQRRQDQQRATAITVRGQPDAEGERRRAQHGRRHDGADGEGIEAECREIDRQQQAGEAIGEGAQGAPAIERERIAGDAVR